MPETILPATATRRPALPRLLNRACRQLLLQRLQGLRRGRLTIREGAQQWRFGDGDSDGPHCEVLVKLPEFWTQVVSGGSLSAGTGYIDGVWDCSDLTSLCRLFCRNRDLLTGLDGGLVSLRWPLRRLAALADHNSRAGAARNIRAHYDLGNKLFERMLDPLMMYSSAIYGLGDDLNAAAARKCAILIEALDLRPGMKVLEIGCGWGGLACQIASHCSCLVDAVTISPAQAARAQQRVAQHGLQDRVAIRLCDYRDLPAQRYDRIVSVEMIEAIGPRQYQNFFHQCADLLQPDGLLLLQSITIADRFFAAARREIDFIKAYIFPGSCIPSLGALQQAVGGSPLQLLDVSDYGPHYARTLADWQRRIASRRAELPNYDARFWRMWDFYLEYCAAGFSERQLSVQHLLYAMPEWRTDAG